MAPPVRQAADQPPHRDFPGTRLPPMGTRRIVSSARRRSSETRLAAPSDKPVIVKFSFRTPRDAWLSSFTTNHPKLRVELHTLAATANNTWSGEFEIIGPSTDWATEIAQSPDVVSVQLLGKPSALGRYRVQFRATQVLPHITIVGLLVRYPMIIEHNVTTVELLTTMRQTRELVIALGTTGHEAEILSIHPSAERSRERPLTPRQRALFRQAFLSRVLQRSSPHRPERPLQEPRPQQIHGFQVPRHC